MPKALSVKELEGKAGKVYFPLQGVDIPDAKPKENEVVVRISAAALNHRDLFIRQRLYPNIGFGVPLLADGCGVVEATGSSEAAKKWKGKRVILNPGTGWKDDPVGPESPNGYVIMGGTKVNPLGTLSETVTIDAGELEEAPEHLSDAEAAAIPLTGVTAWRATMTKSENAKKGYNILITGIGGGVALMALVFATATGANVYVTSGNQEKLEKAKKLGAKDGVIYKDKDWDKQLLSKLSKDRPKFDAIIDGAGGDIMMRASRLLKPGGIVSQYGMTVSPKMEWIMPAVLKNIELRGSTMGSRKEFADMVDFIRKNKVHPVVSRSVGGGISNIKGIDSLFDDMSKGTQFGKLVIEFGEEGGKSKL